MQYPKKVQKIVDEARSRGLEVIDHPDPEHTTRSITVQLPREERHTIRADSLFVNWYTFNGRSTVRVTRYRPYHAGRRATVKIRQNDVSFWLEGMERDLRFAQEIVQNRAGRRRAAALASVGPCPCECNSGGFCGGCGHAGCAGRRNQGVSA